MRAMRVLVRCVSMAGILTVAAGSVGRAADDVVKEEEPAPAPPNNAFQGQMQGGRVIIMPGLRLQVGGQVQVQGNAQVAGGKPAADAAKEPYLGVVAGPVPPGVRAQIDLPDGVGLSVDAVAAGGPAERAGLKQFDVLHKFNDQVVCSPEQLTTLVKVTGAGTTVPLTLLRGGHEKVVEAVIEEREAGADAAGEVIVGNLPGVMNLQGAFPPGIGPQMQADIERKVAEALARAGVAGVVPPGVVPPPGFVPPQGFVPGGPQRMPPQLPPGVVPGVMGNVRAQVLTIGPNAQSATSVSDARGTVEIRSIGGKKTVTVRDPAGKQVHAGPLDTDEDLEKVPEEFRDWVREVDADQPVRPRPDAPKPAPPAEAEEPAAAPEDGADAEKAPGKTI